MIYSGDTNYRTTFEYGENTEVYGSCGATLFGEFWIFGGDEHPRQVFKVRKFQY